MRKIWGGRHDPLDIEAELRAGRPVPPPDFVRAVSAQVRPTQLPAQRVRRFRLAPVVGLTALVLVAAGAFGGIAVATNGGGNQGNNRGEGSNRGGDNGHHGKPDDHQYGNKVVICHKPDSRNPRTIRVPERKVDKYLSRGDELGPCEPT